MNSSTQAVNNEVDATAFADTLRLQSKVWTFTTCIYELLYYLL